MHILLYNWVSFDNDRMKGGGVTVYLRNIISEMLKRDGIKVTFISAGEHYELFGRKPRIVEVNNQYKSMGVRTFEMINSPLKAPAHDAFYAIPTWLHDEKSYERLKDFIKQEGPFDVFHMHNIEGISARALDIKTDFPDLKFFYTLHNYMPYCAQIELLYQGKEKCTDFMDGAKCIGCLNHTRSMKSSIWPQRLGSFFDHKRWDGVPIGNFIFGIAVGYMQQINAIKQFINDIKAGKLKLRSKKAKPSLLDPDLEVSVPAFTNIDYHHTWSTQYSDWRRQNASNLSKRADKVFAVSQLVKDTIALTGEDVDNIEVHRLAMDVSATREQMLERFDKKPDGDLITLSFIGYDIPSKGLPFLIDGFEKINSQFLKEKVRLLVICGHNIELERKLYKLTHRFAKVECINGYNREQLPRIAKEIDLNIVPSIWPETFNQVTWELMVLGTPSLTSDTVGASELFDQTKSRNFVFEVGQWQSFWEKLEPLIKSKKNRRQFFEKVNDLPTMKTHVDDLLSYYRSY